MVLPPTGLGRLEIVSPIALDPEYPLESFFVAGPNDVSMEIVESKPVPEGIWER